jgi:hypothetical protein
MVKIEHVRGNEGASECPGTTSLQQHCGGHRSQQLSRLCAATYNLSTAKA